MPKRQTLFKSRPSRCSDKRKMKILVNEKKGSERRKIKKKRKMEHKGIEGGGECASTVLLSRITLCACLGLPGWGCCRAPLCGLKAARRAKFGKARTEGGREDASVAEILPLPQAGCGASVPPDEHHDPRDAPTAGSVGTIQRLCAQRRETPGAAGFLSSGRGADCFSSRRGGLGLGLLLALLACALRTAAVDVAYGRTEQK